jgi:S-adenosylmethionine-diacylglycerol 3-amino-3-carboxypropyl transferase
VAIARGVIHAGKFERYFHLFRRWVLPLVQSRANVDALRRARDRDEQRAVYERRWDTWRWRAVFQLFFSRTVMGRHGRDPEFFAQVDGPVGARILERTRYALTELPAGTNPYFTYIVTGNFTAEALPMYLRAEHFETIRSRLERLRLAQGPAESAGGGPFDGMNLSDIFEYMTPAEAERCYTALVARARPGARLVYWNMLVARSRPEGLAARVRPLEEVARRLHARDRAWFYQRLRVDEVLTAAAAAA